jgi:NAD(P)-dependent dehydrogenase (short-subunit alcohol dehydrogenase family)
VVQKSTRSIAMETAREGIRVNAVMPGMIMTNMQKLALQDNPEQYEILTGIIPMGRMGEPDDIAHLVVYLASEESRYVTGAEFVVDGGLTVQ